MKRTLIFTLIILLAVLTFVVLYNMGILFNTGPRYDPKGASPTATPIEER